MTSAVEGFRRSLELEDAQPYVWYEYGSLLDKLGRSPEAIPALERALELDPLSPPRPTLWVMPWAVQEGRRRPGPNSSGSRARATRGAGRCRGEAGALRVRPREKAPEENRLDEAIQAFLEMTELNPARTRGMPFAKAHFSRKETRSRSPTSVGRSSFPGTPEYPISFSLLEGERRWTGRS
jgi:tetratricopeptide (TPR) repeat protein